MSSELLEPAEPLARFLLASSHFSVARGRVKPSAFMPPPDLRLSVFRIRGLEEQEVWTMGRQHVLEPAVGRQPNATLYGRAAVLVSAVFETGLQVDPDDTPPRHASITGWPEDKAEQKSTALELAGSAALRLRGPEQ